MTARFEGPAVLPRQLRNGSPEALETSRWPLTPRVGPIARARENHDEKTTIGRERLRDIPVRFGYAAAALTEHEPSHLVPGFRFAGIDAGIKKRGGPDLALIACDGDAVAAGVFTQNIVRAAPVEVAHERVAAGVARAVLVNSGNANACTGDPGTRATLESSAAVAEALGVAPDRVLPCSTGVIGQVLPAERIVSRSAALVAALTPEADGFASAILTTDRFPKIVQCPVETSAGAATLLGIAKGAGMIHPDLDTGLPQATMLAYLLTDAKVDVGDLQAALLAASQLTFNACSVDGDTSTNDTVLALASGVHPGTASR
ncbi:MAG: bifunctional ornithine acetyltransferase/N-acetylglutamate synthase, partial [Myxococcales bacterium]|nr:bifunctional ornithine acetyltransferase/N-acetylglutamate synthase [Myxococcales bacterium]